jgi:hypothetical protein
MEPAGRAGRSVHALAAGRVLGTARQQQARPGRLTESIHHLDLRSSSFRIMTIFTPASLVPRIALALVASLLVLAPAAHACSSLVPLRLLTPVHCLTNDTPTVRPQISK